MDDWSAHVRDTEYQLRLAMARRNQRHPARLLSLWNTVTSKPKLVDEFNSRSPSQRRERLSTALRFLTYHNALLHSVLRFQPTTSTWNVTKEFGRIALVGETLLRSEVLRRFVTALPDADGQLVSRLRDEVVCCERMAKLFDQLALGGCLPPEHRRKHKLTDRQKSGMLYAMVGELHWFVVKTKATDRTHNNALFPPSDALVLHVLSAHCLEGIIGELVFHRLNPAARAVRSVWRNVAVSLPQQVRRKGALSMHLLLHVNPVDRATGRLVGEHEPAPSDVAQTTEGSNESALTQDKAEDTEENADKKVGKKGPAHTPKKRRDEGQKATPTKAALHPLSERAELGSFYSGIDPVIHWKRMQSPVDRFYEKEKAKLPASPTLSKMPVSKAASAASA